MHTWAKGPSAFGCSPQTATRATTSATCARIARSTPGRSVVTPAALRASAGGRVVLQERLRAALVQRERRRAGEPAHGQPQEAAGARRRGPAWRTRRRWPSPPRAACTGPRRRASARRGPAARGAERARHVPAPPRAGRRRGEARERGAGRRAALVGRLVGQADLEARQRRLAERPQRGLGGDARLLLRDRGLLPQGRREVESTTATGAAAATSAQAAPATRASAPASASSAATSADGARRTRPSTSPSSDVPSRNRATRVWAPGAARAARR